ncbi:MAG: lytic transglycosylase domain-containing protein [Gammaproteobacteria bacterium]|nr:lytic transglycosylase domain-containing protein [Gammaproteobacteria bacterium]
MHNLLALLLTALTLGYSHALLAAAEFYKYTDEDGVVTYSQQKPKHDNYKVLIPSCLMSFLGCNASRSDWSQAKLNFAAFKEVISSAAKKYRLEEAYVRAVIHSESAFQQRAVSKAGAEGLMQLMPATQQRFGVSDPFNIVENIHAGCQYLRLLLDMFKGDRRLAAAAYNAGENAVKRYNGIPPYEETKNYVERVSTLYRRYLDSGSGTTLGNKSQTPIISIPSMPMRGNPL